MNTKNIFLCFIMSGFITNTINTIEPFVFPALAGVAIGVGLTASLDLFVPRHVGIRHHDDDTSTLLSNGKLFNISEHRASNYSPVIIENDKGNFVITTVREFQGQENAFIDWRTYKKFNIYHIRPQTRHHYQDNDESKDFTEDQEAQRKIHELLAQELNNKK